MRRRTHVSVAVLVLLVSAVVARADTVVLPQRYSFGFELPSKNGVEQYALEDVPFLITGRPV